MLVQRARNNQSRLLVVGGRGVTTNMQLGLCFDYAAAWNDEICTSSYREIFETALPFCSMREVGLR